jgi:hypothetical protein
MPNRSPQVRSCTTTIFGTVCWGLQSADLGLTGTIRTGLTMGQLVVWAPAFEHCCWCGKLGGLLPKSLSERGTGVSVRAEHRRRT